MSYEKYIKYKTKYLNLKATIHNKQIQSGGAHSVSYDNDFIQTLGSTPNSDIFNNNYHLIGGSKNELSEKSVSSDSESTNSSLPDKLSSSESKNSSLPDKLSSSESKNSSLPDKLSSSESTKKSTSSESPDNLPDKLSSSESESESKQLIGGSRKLKKTVNVFSESDSESDFNESDSSMLSFSSVASTSSSD